MSVLKAMSTCSLKYFIAKKWQLAPKLSFSRAKSFCWWWWGESCWWLGWPLLNLEDCWFLQIMTVKSAASVETSLHERVLCGLWCCLAAFDEQFSFLQNCSFLQYCCWLLKSLTTILNPLLSSQLCPQHLSPGVCFTRRTKTSFHCSPEEAIVPLVVRSRDIVTELHLQLLCGFTIPVRTSSSKASTKATLYMKAKVYCLQMCINTDLLTSSCESWIYTSGSFLGLCQAPRSFHFCVSYDLIRGSY